MILSQVIQPKVITIKRRQNQGFGFTLRHFIAYPPEPWTDTAESYQRKAMETIFIKEVHPDGPAYTAGLKTGDRILMVNNISVAGISYNTIVSMIKQTLTVLKLQVVPKECDILQMYYTDIAHNPETNRSTIDIDRPLMPITSTTHNNFHSRLISYSPEGCPTIATTIHQPISNLQKSTHSFGSEEYILEECQLRPKPQNLPVLQKPNNDEFMVRLRKSIEQKEEFLKPVINNKTLSYQHELQELHPSSTASIPTATQNKILVPSQTKNTNSASNKFTKSEKEFLSAFGNNSSTLMGRNNVGTFGASCNSGLSGFYRNSNQFTSTTPGSKVIHIRTTNSPTHFELGNTVNNEDILNHSTSTNHLNKNQRSYNNHITNLNVGTDTSIKDKFQKELAFLESLPEMGVTNQVFERKLVSNLAKTFDPFKQLSVNTSSSNINDILTEQKTIIKVEGTKIQNYDLIMPSQQNKIEEQEKNRNSSENAIKPLTENEKQYLIVTENYESNDEFQPLSKPYTDVIRRVKAKNFYEENKPMRRISYLRATNNETGDFQIELASDICSEQPEKEMKLKQHIEKQFDNQIQKEDEVAPVQTEKLQKCDVMEKDLATVTYKNDTKCMTDYYETEMEMKSSSIYGKRITEYRSWRHVKIELNGDHLKIYLIRSSKSDNNVIDLNVKGFSVIDETVDKKKFVFRLQSKPLLNSEIDVKRQQEHSDATLASSNTDVAISANNEYTEIIFKTKNSSDMKKLFGLLQEKCENEENIQHFTTTNPLEANKVAGVSSTSTYFEETTTNVVKQTSIKQYSPLSNVKSANLSNGVLNSDVTVDSISPVMKSRKPHSKILPEKELGSPKSKNWKDLLFRRTHNSGNTEASTSVVVEPPKYVGSIGVPLKLCPMSKDNEFVPMIVDICAKIVEKKGLQVVGIYRIPGNKAAISELKEQVNKSDFQWDSVDTDLRWDDVNVVSSLLKLFIRSLPDALLPGTSYINFIEADKKCGERRLKELCYLLTTLPPHSYETMKHIIRHLSRVSKNCEINLMEPKNLAIIFGPSIIRIPNETLDMAVKDMKHQCRIVELLVSQYDYFFENGDLPEANSPPIITTSTYSDQTNLLLDNVSKIEQRLHDKESLTSRLIPHLRRRTHSKRNAVGSDTYSGESVLSLEYKKFSETSMKENIVHSSSSSNTSRKAERSSVEISILLTDEDSSNSRLSDTGSMSLTTITDALDSKLRSLRSGSESTDDTSENSPNKTHESPERHLISSKNVIKSNSNEKISTPLKSLPISARSANFIRDIQKNVSGINNQRFSSVYESCSDDSEVSTTSDPKEAIIMSPLFLERYKKRRDYRLFRSASFNCRNYSSRGGSGNGSVNGGNNSNMSNSLTKDEKTDMNLTKKRQIQNKQNRSIKRRHTVGGPHDYSATTITRRNLNSNENHILEVGIRIKNVNRRN
ncbi:uncharacterized protein LOC129608919 isoform X2 [Condylostylus longicornis]|uniref:uncharacterized protein LOC129608919 isoform X2 n=1 Tax=Condylostylus longicornis TaxID=2530218 RepID=UPI00244DD0F1|nr:uncharacterized protein LOC129608919 isoform X2 [Condylostylus longicornis]